MKLSQLSFFCAVCQYGGVRKAAEILYISQPSISVAIRELEDELGVLLFRRTKNKIVLTTEGQIMFEKSKKILNDVNELLISMRHLSPSNNEIRCAVPPILSITFNPYLRSLSLKNFASHMSLRIIECPADDLVAKLSQGTVDFIISNKDQNHFLQFENEPLFNLPLSLYVGPTHPLASYKIVSADMLHKEYIYTIYFGDSVIYHAITGFLAKHGLSNREVYSRQVKTVENLVYSGSAVSIERKGMTYDNQRLICIPLADAPMIATSLLWNPASPLNADTVQVINYLAELDWLAIISKDTKEST
jgi:DNA-binding transcriptional LysR family regulator